ncbi:MAG: hypothetical protein ACE5EX_11960, partial [Phycisphaerae bacterium]
AFHRCWIAADVLDEAFGEPQLEYGLIGLARPSDPCHVVKTVLLGDQRVTGTSVIQPAAAGREMRRTFEKIARTSGASVPAIWIHRHPSGDCTMSAVDNGFFMGPWINDVSAALPTGQGARMSPTDFGCPCARSRDVIDVEYCTAAALIVSRGAERRHKIYGLIQEFCLACRTSRVRYVPATIRADSFQPLTAAEHAAVVTAMTREIEVCLTIDGRSRRCSGVRP